MPKTKDPEMEQFEKDLLQSVGEMKRDEHAAVHTPAQIEARKRGRPAGSVKESPKVATTIRLDAEVLAALKESGPGWQTRVNDVLRDFVTGARSAAAIEDALARTKVHSSVALSNINLDVVLQRHTEMLNTLRRQLAESTALTTDVVKAFEGLSVGRRKAHQSTELE